MGEELSISQFSKEDEKEFAIRLVHETEILGNWFREKKFVDDDSHFGFELEGVLLDQDYLPSPANHRFLDQAQNSHFVPEIAKFNFEINSQVQTLSSELLRTIHQELVKWMKLSRQTANVCGMHACWIGTLPTLRENDLTLDNMTSSNRYFALAQRLISLRNGLRAQIQISRFDELHFEHPDIMLESAATSVQFHTQVRPQTALATYIAAQWIAGPMVAISANSPFLFGKKLWDETRIAIFEQAIALNKYTQGQLKDPVTFGSKWPENSLHDIFMSNLSYPIILPVLFDSSPEELRHLKMLNGQIWRWNRVIVGTGESPHLRIEHRPLPAGPSAIDTVSNFALYLGLLRSFTREIVQNGWQHYSFEIAKENFYSCAKLGLKANITWGNRTLNVQDLLYHQLLPQARKELLENLELNSADISLYLDQVMGRRIQSGWTGSAWQKSFIDLNGHDFQELLHE